MGIWLNNKTIYQANKVTEIHNPISRITGEWAWFALKFSPQKLETGAAWNKQVSEASYICEHWVQLRDLPQRIMLKK